MNPALMTIRGLSVAFRTAAGEGLAVESLDLDIRRGERLGLVGESGSGKSTAIYAILGMIRAPGRIAGGAIRLEDLELTRLGETDMRRVRLTKIALVPQGAMNALHPLMRVGAQLRLTLASHGRSLTAGELRDLLAGVGLPESVAERYPHELSGGMKQRVCIALAASLKPRLILADEPTSALDVVVQQKVMQSLARLHRENETAILLVGHDMGLMAQFVDRIAILYAGRLMEIGPCDAVFAKPAHPYTKLLIESVPSFDRSAGTVGIPGSAPGLLDRPTGCVFHPRCPCARPECAGTCPPWTEVGADHGASCLLLRNEGRRP